ncbi:MAG: septum formation initiator family protein [Acidobacteria bacterium]|nr:septum formation initiator family protein [Acidobacteriota bacterium]
MPSTPKPPTRPAPTPATAPQPRDRKRVRTGPEVRERRRRALRYALVVVSGLLMVNALFGDKGYLATIQARQEQTRAASALQALRAENARLAEEADRLRNDPHTLEEAARRGLGLIRPGETLITLRDRTR